MSNVPVVDEEQGHLGGSNDGTLDLYQETRRMLQGTSSLEVGIRLSLC